MARIKGGKGGKGGGGSDCGKLFVIFFTNSKAKSGAPNSHYKDVNNNNSSHQSTDNNNNHGIKIATIQ